MQWQELNYRGIRGLETFLSDSTALDVVSYDNGEYSWMIRIPIDDPYTTYEIYASYDNDVYFNNLTEALEDMMKYLEWYFPGRFAETRYRENPRKEKLSLLKSAAIFGIAAVFSFAMIGGLAAPPEALAAEVEGNPDVVVVEESEPEPLYISSAHINGQDVYIVSSELEIVQGVSSISAGELNDFLASSGILYSDTVMTEGTAEINGSTIYVETEYWTQSFYLDGDCGVTEQNVPFFYYHMDEDLSEDFEQYILNLHPELSSIPSVQASQREYDYGIVGVISPILGCGMLVGLGGLMFYASGGGGLSSSTRNAGEILAGLSVGGLAGQVALYKAVKSGR